MDIVGGGATIDSNQFANDNTFELTGGNTLTITVDTGNGRASNLRLMARWLISQLTAQQPMTPSQDLLRLM